MDLKITPSRQIRGSVFAPSSKSYAHRYIISAFLSRKSGFIKNVGNSNDVYATLNALKAVGLDYEMKDDGVSVSYLGGKDNAVIDCKESGSTIRFLFPIICALGIKGEFIGSERLLSRPMQDLTNCLNENGAKIRGFKISGKLSSGNYKITGGVSSQFISGLLFALPILDGDSKIIIDGETVSKDYINITLSVLKDFNIRIEKTDYGYFVKGNQNYIMPNNMVVEGDYSGASFILALGVIGGDVKVLNLNKQSVQGDRKIIDALRLFGGNIEEIDDGFHAKKSTLNAIALDCEDIPDLVQILSVVGAFASGKTVLKRVSRLQIKESDRIGGIIKNLEKAGVKAEFDGNDLTIYGNSPVGGIFSGDNDHRTVMSSSVLSAFCDGDSIVLGAEAVSKSYPNFFKDYIALGGQVDGDI